MSQYQDLELFKKKFPFYVRRSSYIHIALFSLMLFGGKIIFEQTEKLREKNMQLVQSSVRVEMVAMPTMTMNELKNLSSGAEDARKEEKAPTPEAKKEAIKEAKEEAQDKSDSASNFEQTNKLKRQSFLSKLKELGNKKINNNGTQKTELGLRGEKATNLKNLVMAGNKLNKGSAMYGDGNEQELTAFQVYAGSLPDVVRPHWRLPSFLMDKKLKCRIRVWIAINGEVLRAEVYQSSGDNEYDQRAIEAIKSASPFPRMAAELGKRGQNGDIALGFPL